VCEGEKYCWIYANSIRCLGWLIAMALLLATLPLIQICYVAGALWIKFSREEIELLDDGFVLRGRIKSRKFCWHEIVKIKRFDGPPTRRYALLCVDGRVIQLNPFTEAKALLRKLTSFGIPVEVSDD
jgi:hypothetical protein